MAEDASMCILIFPFFHVGRVFLLIPLFLYFLPAFLARHRSDFSAILLVNVLAGWTFIGWIIALVWALSAEPQRQAAAPPQAAPTGPAQAAASPGFFCNSCGKPCTAGARFCSFCGAALPVAPG